MTRAGASAADGFGGGRLGEPRVVLDRSVPPVAVVDLDGNQTRVRDHSAGPLLILGGPGTGKTTALVGAAAARVLDGVDASRVLVLTLGRTAVADLRLQLAARLPGHAIPEVRTWHGFAYAVVDSDRLAQAGNAESGEQAAVVGPLQLLSGAEYEARIRELIVSAAADGLSSWPASLNAALPTRGFARDVRALLVALSTLGLDPRDLARMADTVNDRNLAEVWRAAASFAREAFDVFGFEGVTDHADVLNRAGFVLAESDTARFDYIYVDQAHDLDPAMLRILVALQQRTRALVMAADPDQAVESFRGAEPRLLSNVVQSAFGKPVDVQLLTTDYVHGPALRSVISHISSRIPAPVLDRDVVQRIRAAQSPHAGHDLVQVHTFDTAAAEAAHIADLIVRAHTEPEHALPLSDMAIVVHGPSAFRPLARALGALGIPFDIPREEMPLRDDPAVRVLLNVLDIAVVRSRGGVPSAERVRTFLQGPLARLDSAALRRLARTLRTAARDAGDQHVNGDTALVEAVLDPRLLLVLPDDPDAAALQTASELLATMTAAVQSRQSVSEVLWTLWTTAATYADRLARAALSGGAEGRRADRDLDAIMGLFDAAERADARYQGRRGIAAFVDEITALDFASESLASSAPVSAVTILTARRARGQFWPLVIVAGLNDGEWPRLATGTNIVGADRLSSAGVVPPPNRSARLADERRVFHLAASRARQRLVLTAVASGNDDGPQPSPFIRDIARLLNVELDKAPAHVSGFPSRPRSATGVVAGLRRLGVAESSSPSRRAAVAARLAALAVLTDDAGNALVGAANPAVWWGVADVTAHERPLHDPAQPIALSGTGLQSIEDCTLKRFFEREAAAKETDTSQAAFGTVVHAVAEALVKKTLAPDIDAVEQIIDTVWPALASDAAWAAAQERAEASVLAQRLLAYHLDDRREAVASESRFDVTIEVPLPAGAVEPVRLIGSIDRVEITQSDPTGVHIVDFKTGNNPPARSTVPENPQLGVYRLAVQHGAVDDQVRDAHVASAELVHLRKVSAKGEVRVDTVVGPADDSWRERIGAAIELVRTERLQATPGDACRFCRIKRVCPAEPAGRPVIP